MENAGYWLHEVVRNNTTLAGVERGDARVVRDVYHLRAKADYENKFIAAEEIREYFPRVQRILIELGMNV
jgi:hypothetical protein